MWCVTMSHANVPANFLWQQSCNNYNVHCCKARSRWHCQQRNVAPAAARHANKTMVTAVQAQTACLIASAAEQSCRLVYVDVCPVQQCKCSASRTVSLVPAGRMDIHRLVTHRSVMLHCIYRTMCRQLQPQNFRLLIAYCIAGSRPHAHKVRLYMRCCCSSCLSVMALTIFEAVRVLVLIHAAECRAYSAMTHARR